MINKSSDHTTNKNEVDHFAGQIYCLVHVCFPRLWPPTRLHDKRVQSVHQSQHLDLFVPQQNEQNKPSNAETQTSKCAKSIPKWYQQEKATQQTCMSTQNITSQLRKKKGKVRCLVDKVNTNGGPFRGPLSGVCITRGVQVPQEMQRVLKYNWEN